MLTLSHSLDLRSINIDQPPYHQPLSNPLQSLERLIFKMKVMVNHSSTTKARGGKGAGGSDSGTGRGGNTNKTVWVGNLKIRKIDGSGT